MSGPATLSMPILTAAPVLDRFTFGQIQEAADAIGEPGLLAGVIKGDKCFRYAACRFLTRETQDCVECPERTECHRAFAI
jgi:hypothetical protein